jgi:hypothetical protein
VIATAMTLYFAAQSMNLMVFGGLAAALVLIIDDAVVLGCNLKRRLASPRPPDQSTAQIITAALTGSGPDPVPCRSADRWARAQRLARSAQTDAQLSTRPFRRAPGARHVFRG